MTNSSEFEEKYKKVLELIKRDAANAGSQWLVFIAGAVGIYLLVVLSLVASNYAFVETFDIEARHWTRSAYWIIHFIAAIAIVFVVFGISVVLAYLNPISVTRLAVKFRDLISQIEEITPAISAVEHDILPSLKKHGDSLSSVLTRLNLLENSIFVFSPKYAPGETESEFICSDDLINGYNETLRIVGTMIGTYGESSFNVVEHIGRLTELKCKRTPSHPEPFKECRIVVPSCKGYEPDSDDSAPCTRYPYAARAFAIKTLLKIQEAWANAAIEKRPDVSIRIRFSRMRDSFPALQTWDRCQCLIVPSVGYEDLHQIASSETITAISEAIPFGIGVREKFISTVSGKERTCELDRTLSRIMKHFDDDLFHERVSGDEIETWSFVPHEEKILVKDWQSGASGGVFETNVHKEMKDTTGLKRINLPQGGKKEPASVVFKFNQATSLAKIFERLTLE